MLTNRTIMAVLPATDLDRARNFYQDKLGLNVEDMASGEEIVIEAATGSKLLLYRKPEGTKGEHTEASFLVDDLEKELSELRERGVTIEEYDQPGLKTINGIMTEGNTKTAWFKDSEGNILNLYQQAA